MDSDCGDSNFGFAFNQRNFSDRVLRLEILTDPETRVSESSSAATLGVLSSIRRKRHRGPYARTENALDINSQPEEHILDLKSHPDCQAEIDNHDVLLIQDIPPGHVNLDSDDSDCSEDVSKVLRVEALNISSLILAAKSPFFYKMFSNGIDQREVTLRVSESEEAAFKELLNFVYTSTLSSNTSSALLDVLIAADKFEVASCIRHCCRLLKNLPMTPENALLYLDLPSNILMADYVKPLVEAAKQFLASHYKDVSKHQDELMNLPLAGVEAMLSSNELQVANEDTVFDFAVKWARFHYPDLEERRNILSSSCLGRLIRFRYMSPRKLRKLVTCPDFDHDYATETVLDALFFKVEPHHRRTHPSEEASSIGYHYSERQYKYRPIKIIGFKHPRPQCVVYLNLKREECSKLYPLGRLYSQAFHLGGQGFFLSAHCNMDQQSSFHCFGLFLGMQEKGSVSFAIDYEFSARMKMTEEFVSKYKGNHTFTGGKAVGYRNLFSMPWSSFIGEDSNYFIDDVLYLRAELTIRGEAND